MMTALASRFSVLCSAHAASSRRCRSLSSPCVRPGPGPSGPPRRPPRRVAPPRRPDRSRAAPPAVRDRPGATRPPGRAPRDGRVPGRKPDRSLASFRANSRRSTSRFRPASARRTSDSGSSRAGSPANRCRRICLSARKESGVPTGGPRPPSGRRRPARRRRATVSRKGSSECSNRARVPARHSKSDEDSVERPAGAAPPDPAAPSAGGNGNPREGAESAGEIAAGGADGREGSPG